MASDRIAVPYNHKAQRLEALLAGVERAGDFFVQGSLDAPIPRVEIDGVGVLSFPVPGSQIEAVIKRAHRAPYGRGQHTIVDTSVRNAWQLDSADVRIGGKAWEKTFRLMMSTVIAGLGCSGMNVVAGETHGRDHVGGPDASSDQARAPVDGAVPDCTGDVVVGVVDTD